MRLRALLIIAAAGLWVGVAQAQTQAAGSPPASPAPQAEAGPNTDPAADRRADMAAVRAACAPDMQTLCPGQVGRQAAMCLRDNRDKLAPACKAALATVRHRPDRWFDGKPLPHGWIHGGPDHYSLSVGVPPPSPQQLAAQAAAKQACAPDRQTLCPGKTGHDAMMCMRQNRDKLSQVCKDARAKARQGHAHSPGEPTGPQAPSPPPAPTATQP